MHISKTLAALLLLSASYGSFASCSVDMSSKQILDCIVAEADCKVDEIAAKDYLVNLPGQPNRDPRKKPSEPQSNILM